MKDYTDEERIEAIENLIFRYKALEQELNNVTMEAFQTSIVANNYASASSKEQLRVAEKIQTAATFIQLIQKDLDLDPPQFAGLLAASLANELSTAYNIFEDELVEVIASFKEDK